MENKTMTPTPTTPQRKSFFFLGTLEELNAISSSEQYKIIPYKEEYADGTQLRQLRFVIGRESVLADIARRHHADGLIHYRHFRTIHGERIIHEYMGTLVRKVRNAKNTTPGKT